jgi:hypothetical protein
MNYTFWLIITYILMGICIISAISTFVNGIYGIYEDSIWQDSIKETRLCIISFIVCIISLIGVCVLGCMFCG